MNWVDNKCKIRVFLMNLMIKLTWVGLMMAGGYGVSLGKKYTKLSNNKALAWMCYGCLLQITNLKNIPIDFLGISC